MRRVPCVVRAGSLFSKRASQHWLSRSSDPEQPCLLIHGKCIKLRGSGTMELCAWLGSDNRQTGTDGPWHAALGPRAPAAASYRCLLCPHRHLGMREVGARRRTALAMFRWVQHRVWHDT